MGDDQRTRSLRAGGERPRSEPPQDLSPGHRVGAWTIVRKLGGGGCGEVYEVLHHENQQRAALKVLHAHFTASPEMLARFDREIRVLMRLRHPSVVQVVEAGFDADGRPFLCMELLQGQDLGRILATRRFDLPAARRIFEPVCDAITAAHQLDIIHRDIKASNVFVCDDGRAVLLDFGIAKLSDALAPELTASHQSLGTPGSMAPEQIHGQRVDARTDVYGLASLLFHMLTGRLPFDDSSATMTQYLHLHARRPVPSSLVPIAKAVDDVIVRAMAIEPYQRFANVPALVSALRIAARDSKHDTSVSTVEQTAIFVTVEDVSGGQDLDEALIADFEAVLPLAERALAEQGFALALDLGTSALFIARQSAQDGLRSAVAAWERLEARPTLDPRVRVGMCVHRGPTTIAANRIEPCALLRPDTWSMPDPLVGLWATSAIQPVAGRLR